MLEQAPCRPILIGRVWMPLQVVWSSKKNDRVVAEVVVGGCLAGKAQRMNLAECQDSGRSAFWILISKFAGDSSICRKVAGLAG